MGLLKQLDKMVSSPELIPASVIGVIAIFGIKAGVDAERENHRINLTKQVAYLVAGDDNQITAEEANSALAELGVNYRVSTGKDFLFGQDGKGIYLTAVEQNTLKNYIPTKSVQKYLDRRNH